MFETLSFLEKRYLTTHTYILRFPYSVNSKKFKTGAWNLRNNFNVYSWPKNVTNLRNNRYLIIFIIFSFSPTAAQNKGQNIPLTLQQNLEIFAIIKFEMIAIWHFRRKITCLVVYYWNIEGTCWSPLKNH